MTDRSSNITSQMGYRRRLAAAANDAGHVDPFPELPPEAYEALRRTLADSPLSVLLSVAGHHRGCIMRVRAGRSLGCTCGPGAQPLDDAATATALAIRFAQMGASRRIPVPRGVIAALAAQVEAGDPAAALVWQWLAHQGLVPAQAPRPKPRPVKGSSR